MAKRVTSRYFDNFFGDRIHKDWLNLMSQNFYDYWTEGRGIIRGGSNFKDCTFYNGIRYTTDVPPKYKNTIYFLGPCITMGIYVTDEKTIESILQRKLNKNKIPYRIVNLGGMEGNLKKIIKNIDLIEGDILIIVMQEMLDCHIKKLGFNSLEQAFIGLDHERRSLFWDDIVHCNARANQRIAAYIYPYLLSFIDTGKLENNAWKEHNIYTIFNNDNDINRFEKEVECFLQNIGPEIKADLLIKETKDIGAIVMNANPFTLGHQFLVEEAAKRCSILYVFVLEEDKSFFSFADRFAMVREGTAFLENVIVIPSGQFIISQMTLPDYFKREQYRNKGENIATNKTDYSLDIRIFGKFIAPKLGINKRFVGEEPIDAMTCEYNSSMKILLPKYGVELIVLKRKCNEQGELISASFVRKLLAEGNISEIKDMVPLSTYNYLKKLYD